MIINILIAILGIAFSVLIFLQYRKNGSRELIGIIPSVWTSLGILGTFVALVFSLKGLDVNKIDISGLVTSIAPAFETSIIGIAMALVSSTIIKIHLAKEDKREDDLYYDTVGKDVSPEMLLNKLYMEQKATNNTIKRMMTKISEDVISTISQAIEDKVEILIDKHVESIADALDTEQKHLNDITSSFTDNIEKLNASTCRTLDKYSKDLSKSIRESDFHIVDSFNKSKDEWFSGVEESLNAASKMLSDNLRLVQTTMTGAADRFANVTKQTDSISKSVGKICASVDREYSSMGEIPEKLSTLIESINELLDSTHACIYQIRQMKPDETQAPASKPLWFRKTKECPDCGEENPIDAEFCRNCRHHFDK